MQRRERIWTIVLVASALVLPVGSLLQPWLFPSRSAMPLIRPGLDAVAILVTVPGLRTDRVHHLGYARETTPVLDRMALEGVSFRRAYAASNDPRLTLAAIASGVLPATVGMQATGDALPPDASTLAERIRQDGGHTLCVRADPAQLGMQLEQGFDEVVDLPPDTPADVLFERALRVLLDPPEGPLFVWIDLPDLRWPYGGEGFDAAAEAPALAAGVPRGYGDACTSGSDVGSQADARPAPCLGSLDPEPLGRRYDAALHRLDASLGRFLDALAAELRLETASLCVAGTSGAPLAERADRWSGEGLDLYEPSVHVPLVFRLASRAVRGRVLDEFANSVDIGPTLLKLTLKAGASSEWRGGCGRSLLTTMTDRRETNALALGQGRHRAHGAARDVPSLVVWTDRFKLITPLAGAGGAGRYELYDLLADPGESSPGDSRNDVIAGAIVKKARAWQADCDDR